MKKIVTFFATALISVSMYAQAPNKMSYQSVIRNTSNALVTSAAVGMRISILQTTPIGTAVYVETQTPTTNTNGLATIEIGGGTVVTGNFAVINWANGPYFVKTETDPTGGTNYSITSTSQLLSVPYALYSESTGDTSMWKKNGNDIYYNNGKVGIGTQNPITDFVIDKNVNGGTIANIYNYNTGNSVRLAYQLRNSGSSGAAWSVLGAGYNGSGSSDIYKPNSSALETDCINGLAIGSRLSDIRFYTGSPILSERLTITSSGNVGIGSTSPAQKLSVAGIIETTNGGVKFPDGTIQTTASTGGASQWTANGSAIYYNMGNVGIRIPANINYPLVVGGTTRITDNIGSTPDEFTIIPETNNNRIRLVGSYFNLGTYPDFSFELAGTSTMFMQASSGNVGIGTTSPARTLHVNSVMRLEPIATAPTSPAKGDMYFDSTLNKLRVYDGSTWQNCW